MKLNCSCGNKGLCHSQGHREVWIWDGPLYLSQIEAKELNTLKPLHLPNFGFGLPSGSECDRGIKSSFPLKRLTRRHSALTCKQSTPHMYSNSRAHSTSQNDEVLELTFLASF